MSTSYSFAKLLMLLNLTVLLHLLIPLSKPDWNWWTIKQTQYILVKTTKHFAQPTRTESNIEIMQIKVAIRWEDSNKKTNSIIISNYYLPTRLSLFSDVEMSEMTSIK